MDTRLTFLLLLFCLTACDGPATQQQTPPDTSTRPESPKAEDTARPARSTLPRDTPATSPAPRTYANARFRNVTVRKEASHRYLISGEGQIFEAAFSWVVEDGHQELLTGHAMTDAGAPEWGRFSFPVEVRKQRRESTLTLILFESSPKDGSRQHELPLLLD